MTSNAATGYVAKISLANIDQNQFKICQNRPNTPKVNMLKFGDVSFDLGFERGRMSATGYVAKISMLRLNIGSGKLSSCMLSIGLGPKCEQGKGVQPPLALNGFGSSANAEHA